MARFGPYIERDLCGRCEYVGDFPRGGPCPRCGYHPWSVFGQFHYQQIGRWKYEGPWWWPFGKRTWVPHGEGEPEGER